VKQHLLKTAIALTLAIVAPVLCLAAPRWMPIPDRQLIMGSDLIVVGKIVWVEDGEPGTASSDMASILVAEVLKGSPDVVMVKLRYPGKKRGYLTYNGKFEPTRTERDVFFSLDQEGIWFLKRCSQDEDAYVAEQPAHFKPLFFKDKIVAAIARH